MKFLLAFMAMGMALNIGEQAAQTPSTDWAEKGRGIVQQVTSGQFAAVESQYDQAMSNALPPGKLEEAWKSLIAQTGPFQKISSTKVEAVQTYQRVMITCAFEKTDLNVQVVFESDGKLAGLRFVPVVPPDTWTPPSYVNEKLFHEQPLTVVNGKFELPGTLTIPVGNGPFPGVVLVQGSGPHDQDETIGPNKPFKDLAWGLASRGVAVLRYTKRTQQYGAASSADYNSLTVEDETMSDARAAVALLQKQPGVNPKHVYLLGHSLGAMLAPRIAASDAQIAGIIVMAGNTRPMEQLVVDQVNYLGALPGANKDAAEKQIAAAEEFKKQVEDPNLKQGTVVDMLGAKIPASYWLDLRDYKPAEIAAKLSVPMLILQGGRDYQVTKPDYEGWQKALAGHSNATLKWYPQLTHLFIAGTGLSTPQEYDQPGHVSEEVVSDISAWVVAGGKNK